MPRYLVFAGDLYYPSGGWGDFRARFDTIDAAIAYIRDHASNADWYELVDLVEGRVIECDSNRGLARS